MSCETEIINPRKTGNTFHSLEFEVLENNTAKSLVDATISMSFRKNNAVGPIVKSISDTDGITITDGINGKFETDEFICDFKSGKYCTDVKIIFSDGEILNYQTLFFDVLNPVTL